MPGSSDDQRSGADRRASPRRPAGPTRPRLELRRVGSLLAHLAACFPHARQVDITVAFVLTKGVALIRPYALGGNETRQLRLIFDTRAGDTLQNLAAGLAGTGST